MKNLTHYFTEPLKPKKPEVTSNVEVVDEQQTTAAKKQQETVIIVIIKLIYVLKLFLIARSNCFKIEKGALKGENKDKTGYQ